MKISEAFNLSKTQAELDFVDVELDRDTPLFIDPFAISQRLDSISQECHLSLQAFFQRIVDSIRAGQDTDAQALLRQLREPNETRLGFSTRRPQGAGIGAMQAGQIFVALRSSTERRGLKYQTYLKMLIHQALQQEEFQSDPSTQHGEKNMAKAPKHPGLDGRSRNEDGEIRKKRNDTLVGTLRNEYGDDFAKGYRSDTKLGTVLERKGLDDLSQLLKKKRG